MTTHVPGSAVEVRVIRRETGLLVARLGEKLAARLGGIEPELPVFLLTAGVSRRLGLVAAAWAGIMVSADVEKGLAMNCIRCGSERTRKDGQTRLGGQRWRCSACGRRFTARSTSAFSHHAFPDDVIALGVRWYVRYRLSYADVVEWFAERGLIVNRSTVYRWVQRFLPLFGEAARAHRRPVGAKWRVDETYCRLNGKWTYIYRAIDQDGQVVDAYFSKRRNAAAAEGFFRRAIDETGARQHG